MSEDSKPIGMGIGPLGSEMVFPRTFRFLFIPKNNPELQYFVQKVTVNYIDKTLQAKIYELQDLSTHDWCVNMAKKDVSDDFTLIALDGCGNKLYVLEFDGVQVDSHSCEYNYEDSDVVSHHVGMTYKDMKKIMSSKRSSIQDVLAKKEAMHTVVKDRMEATKAKAAEAPREQ